MKLLITAGASSSAQTLAAALMAKHDVRLIDRVAAGSELDYAVAPLGHDASTRLLVQDRDAIILLCPQPLEGDSEHMVIDVATRGVYNLLTAAVEGGVRRVICISTLELMHAYDTEFTVSERWRPRPTTAPPNLGAYLTECVCREFAREHKLDVVVLRSGTLTADGSAPTAGSDVTYVSDLVEAVELALTAKLEQRPQPWGVYHIQSNVPAARFATTKAERELGYRAVAASAN